MVKLQKFSVAFNDGKSTYVPGDVVSGNLEIQLDDTMEMKEIRIKLSGKAHVSWNEGKHNYTAKERFFTQSSVVHGGGGDSSSNDMVSLPQGRHTFPFHFQLPEPLASSYEDSVGYIRYYVKARINKPAWFDNKTIAVINVQDKLDLNQLSGMMVASGGAESKNLCCLCCASGPIEGEIQLNRRGYVPGEWVVANGSLSNYSSSRVEATSVEIVTIITYRTSLRARSDTRTLAKELGPGCNPGGTVNMNNVKLQIPPVPPSESAHCNIIDIQYAVMLMGHLRTFAINLRAYAPIVVGTKPLSTLPMYNDLPGVAGSEPSDETPPEAPASTLTTTYGIQAPPPSYAAATIGAVNVRGNDENTTGDTTFTPQYTFYDWNQSAFTYN